MLQCSPFMHSRADCEKSNDRIYSTPVSNKTPGISASLKLWYLIVSQLVLEIFKNFMKNFTLKKVYFLSIRTWFHAFPTFFKLLAFPQFLRYDDEIDMIYHAWMEYDSLKISRDGMNGSDFRRKTVGPVCFETVGTLKKAQWDVAHVSTLLFHG